MREEPTPMPENVTRRRFIKRSGGATVGTAIGLYALQSPAWAQGEDDSSEVLTLHSYPKAPNNIDDQHVTWAPIGSDNLTICLIYSVTKHDPSKVVGYQPNPEVFDGEILAKVRLVKWDSLVGPTMPGGTNSETGENSDGNMYLNHKWNDPTGDEWHKYTSVASISSTATWQAKPTTVDGVKKASVSLTTIAPAQEGVVTFNGTKYKLGLDVKHTPPVGTPNVGDPAGIGLEYRGNVGWDANNPTNTITIKWGGIGPEGPIFPNFEYERGDGTKAEAGPIRSANFGAEYSIEPKEEE